MADPTSPEKWLQAHGDALFRFAYVRVRDREAAKDLVQETLLAAWRGRTSFAGSSSEQTWLIGILKNKLADHWRACQRQGTVAEPHGDAVDDSQDLLEEIFDTADGGHWRFPPSPWRNPDAALEQQEFWAIFVECLNRLPPAQAQAFNLCELDGVKGEEACKELNVAATNLWVMLHRARLRLRQCLETRWFGRANTGG